MTDLPIWLTGLLLIVGLPAAVVACQAGLRRLWPALLEGDHNEVTGFIIAVVGVIYAVLLGFVVIVSWENFDEAENVVGQEASALRTMYRDSAAFPPPIRDQIHADVRNYAATVVRTASTTWSRRDPHAWTSQSRACPGCCGRHSSSALWSPSAS